MAITSDSSLPGGALAERERTDYSAGEFGIKRAVLHRGPSLLFGNEPGGLTSLIVSSLTGTCGRHGIDPLRYPTQVLATRSDPPVNRLSGWWPGGSRKLIRCRHEGCGR